MRLSGKTVRDQIPGGSVSIPAHFNKPEAEATIRDKGYACVYEKAYSCPCKDKEVAHKGSCKNCGGTGWVFMNPANTRLIISGIQHDSKLKEAALSEMGLWELGVVNVTATNEVKMSMMDRITIMDATAEHSQILYIYGHEVTSELFTFTKYDIKSIEYVAVFIDTDTPLLRLVEGVDYTFQDNILKFISGAVSEDNQITIRSVHHPVFHVIDILRESFSSYNGNGDKLTLPVKAVAKRAHLIKDAENFDGDRLFDNSWLPECPSTERSNLELQIKYADPIAIYNMMTPAQQAALAEHIGSGPVADAIVTFNGSPIATLEPGETLAIESEFGLEFFVITP
jgi:hypothetical protein